MVRCSARARSNSSASSLVHEPTIQSRSWLSRRSFLLGRCSKLSSEASMMVRFKLLPVWPLDHADQLWRDISKRYGLHCITSYNTEAAVKTHNSILRTLIFLISYTPNPSREAYSMWPGSRRKRSSLGSSA